MSGELQNWKASRPVLSEHWKRVPSLFALKEKLGVLSLLGLVGAELMVTTEATVSMVKP